MDKSNITTFYSKTTKECSIDGCGRRRAAKNYCSAHYKRFKRHGDPLGGMPAELVAKASKCVINDCGQNHYAKGYCCKHYMRNRKYGSPTGGRKTDHGERLQWLISNTNHTNKIDCLPWPFCKDGKGYGVAVLNGAQTTASRAMCILAKGLPPSDTHQAAHNCGQGHNGCVNPNHLRWATIEENHADKIIHGTSGRGNKSALAKLSEAEVNEIIAKSKAHTGRELAEIYGVHFSTISSILTGKNWAWLNQRSQPEVN